MKAVLLTLPVIMGFILDMLIGDPYNIPHPVRLMGKVISRLEIILRGLLPEKERTAGVLLVLIVELLSVCIPTAILFFCYRINIWAGIAAESIMCCYLLAARCLERESMKVYRALVSDDMQKAKEALSMIVGRDTAGLDRNGIIRAAVETVAENTSDGVTAPLFYIMPGGAAAGFFYKAANTMDSMIGYKNEKYIDFGYFAARLDDVLNFIPSRITALIMIMSAFILGFDGKNAWKIWRRDRTNHASPNSAQTESVCAGALDIMLGGDAYYSGKLVRKKTIGDNIHSPENDDICRANRLMYCTSVIMLITAAAVRAAFWRTVL